MKTKKELIRIHVIIAVVLTVYIALVTFTPLDWPIKMVHGFACPFCGLTRAWISALTFDFAQAFSYHPLFLFAPFLIFMSFHKKLFKRINEKVYDLIVVGGAFIFFVTYVIRMILTSGKL